MNIDDQTVRKIAQLACIDLTEETIHPMKESLIQILNWVEQLRGVPTEEVSPLFSVLLDHMPQRDDQVTDGNQQKAILANAPQTEHGLFVVPKFVK